MDRRDLNMISLVQNVYAVADKNLESPQDPQKELHNFE